MITKSKSLGQLIKTADEVFSEYVRRKDKDDRGFIYCFICGKPVPWRSAHAMHFIDRHQMAVRYDEMNVNAGCYECNVLDDNHKLKYLRVMKFHYGDVAVARLNQRAQSLQKFMPFELEELIADFKTRIKTLKK